MKLKLTIYQRSQSGPAPSQRKCAQGNPNPQPCVSEKGYVPLKLTIYQPSQSHPPLHNGKEPGESLTLNPA